MGSSSLAGLVLALPENADDERDRVAAAWEQQGGSIVRIDRFWDPPPLDRASVRLYGNDTFCLVLAQKLGLQLVSPPDDLLLRAGDLCRRWIRSTSLEDALAGPFPAFVKPLVPKVFRAGVWPDAEALATECTRLDPRAPVLVSEIVRLQAEARSFVLDGEVLSCAIYEGSGDVDAARAFLAAAAKVLPTGRTCALDAGLIEGRGWALLEANATWGAGLNGCDASAAATCLAEATLLGAAA